MIGKEIVYVPFVSNDEFLKVIAQRLPKKSLAILFPDIAKEWHPFKNNPLLPTSVSYGTDKKVWWLCNKGHEWEASIGSRTINGRGCPYCSNQAVCDDNSLESLFPDISKEWHSSKNGNWKPSDVVAKTKKKVWWKCKHGHEWEAAVGSRTHLGSGCPYCAGQKSKE